MIKFGRLFRCAIVATAALCAGVPRSASAQVATAAGSSREISVRLRIEWGGGAARRWNVIGQSDAGTLSDPAPLGVEVDEPGSMWAADGRWFVEPRTPRTYDGADVRCTATAEGTLVLTFVDADGAQPTRHEIPVESLVDDVFYAPLDDTGNRLVVRRVPGDRLRVELDYSSLIFGPGAVLSMQVQPHLLNAPPRSAMRLTATLRAARQTQAIWSGGTDVSAPADDSAWPAVPITLRLPEEEGVYDVALEMTGRAPSGQALPSVRRAVQVVVVSPTAPPRRADLDPTLSNVLLEIDPASPAWSERLKQMTTLPGQRRTHLGNVRTTTRMIGRASYAELPATAAPEDPGWQAFPLAVAQPGTLHIVEIEYPSDVAQSLSVSLVEPNALGAITPLGVDAGLHVDPIDVEPTSRRLTRRFIVWPRSAAPLLVLTNRRRDAPAVFGKIRLYGARAGGGVPYLSRDADAPPTLPVEKNEAELPDGRLAAAYFDRPLFPENFGASSAVDAAADGTERCLDDWVTYFDGATRLVEYLRHVGYNGLMMTVVADGSAIYPSTLIEPTPRYDDGTFFATGQDPLRKDVVELLMRLCDREGLRFVPAVQFTAPLPRLEALRRQGVSEIEPRGRDGRTWNEAQAASGGGAGPRYNPLDPRVRREMNLVLGELTKRYAAHPSWGGAAVHLSANGYALLPGVEWCGLDSATLRRCAGEMQPWLEQHAAPAGPFDPLGAHRDAWIAWRMNTMTGLYAEFAATVGAKSTSAPLYFITAHTWRRPDLQQRLQPSLPARPGAEVSLRERGVDAAYLAGNPNIQWLRPIWDGPLDDPAAHGADMALNRDETLEQPAVESPNPGTLIFHEPQLQRLESFEKQSPYQPAYVRLVTESSATGAAGRRRLVRQLASGDSTALFYGGWMLPLGEEDGVRRIAGVMQALPPERFATVAGAPSHVVVRTLSRDARTYVYVVNDAPWPTTVTFDVAAAGELELQSLNSVGAKLQLREADGRRTLTASLEPYDVSAATLSQPDVVMSNVQGTIPDGVAEQLDARIRELWARCGSLQRAPPPIAVENADFETTANAGQRAVGWDAIGGAGLSVATAEPHGGRHAVRLTSVALTGGGLTSNPIPTPRSGRASISVWLRSSADGETSPVRLGLDAKLYGRPYSRTATVGDDGAAPLGPEWRQFLFPLNDLPTAGLSDVRLRVELTGPGEVYVDDVSVSELEFSAAERLELSKTISLAELRLQRGEHGECARLLEGYWPRFLTAYAPPGDATSPNDAATPVAARPSPRPAPQAESPAVRDRLRKWLPEFLR